MEEDFGRPAEETSLQYLPRSVVSDGSGSAKAGSGPGGGRDRRRRKCRYLLLKRFRRCSRGPSRSCLKRRLSGWPRTRIRNLEFYGRADVQDSDSETDAASEALGPPLAQQREDTEGKLPSLLPAPLLRPEDIEFPDLLRWVARNSNFATSPPLLSRMRKCFLNRKCARIHVIRIFTVISVASDTCFSGTAVQGGTGQGKGRSSYDWEGPSIYDMSEADAPILVKRRPDPSVISGLGSR